MSKFLQIQESSMEFKEIDVKEDKKNLDAISKIWEDMFEKSIQRSSTVLCIGEEYYLILLDLLQVHIKEGQV